MSGEQEADFMRWLAQRNMWVVHTDGGPEGGELSPVTSAEAGEIMREWRAVQEEQ